VFALYLPRLAAAEADYKVDDETAERAREQKHDHRL
jgi:hypothetical protein